jgi:hypothetical protein
MYRPCEQGYLFTGGQQVALNFHYSPMSLVRIRALARVRYQPVTVWNHNSGSIATNRLWLIP